MPTTGNGHGKPVVALDIDGTLGDYHGHFLRFAEGWFGRQFPPPGAINPGLKLWEHMGVPVEQYRLCKLAYRQGGLKRTMSAYPGASHLAKSVRLMEAEVWICTTRPYMRLDNIDPDTQEWLRRNDIPYDGVLFDTLEGKYTKYKELKRQAGGRVCAVVDDLPELVVEARNQFPTGIALVMREQPYNVTFPCEQHPLYAIRAKTSKDIYLAVADAVEQWREQHVEQ